MASPGAALYPIFLPVVITLGPVALAVTLSTPLDVTPEWVPALAKEELRAKSTLGALALGAGALRLQRLIPAHPNTHFGEPVLQMHHSKTEPSPALLSCRCGPAPRPCSSQRQQRETRAWEREPAHFITGTQQTAGF